MIDQPQIIAIDLTEDRPLKTSVRAGVQGEHNAVTLEITLPERLQGYSGYYAMFGNDVSAPLECVDGVISVALWRTVTSRAELNNNMTIYAVNTEPEREAHSHELTLSFAPAVMDVTAQGDVGDNLLAAVLEVQEMVENAAVMTEMSVDDINNITG
ncbi:MAG: hypothetical protein LBQ80_04140 [Clostridium sp.]|jgi:hypothetical protein|nr:hypothetical protein [Clostridium sp.]